MRQPFERKFTGEQFEAIFDAHLRRGISYPSIRAMALAGELIKGEPFDISTDYIGRAIRNERKRLGGQAPSELAALAPVDAIEHMRQSLLNLWAAERNKLERQTEGKRDLARASQIARLALDIARIPSPKDPRPDRAPGSNTPGVTREPDAPRGKGPVGSLLAAFRQEAVAQNGEAPHSGGAPDPAGEATG